MATKDFKSPSVPGSVLGYYDKVVGGVIGAILIAMLFWIGNTTQENALDVREVKTQLKSLVSNHRERIG